MTDYEHIISVAKAYASDKADDVLNFFTKACLSTMRDKLEFSNQTFADSLQEIKTGMFEVDFNPVCYISVNDFSKGFSEQFDIPKDEVIDKLVNKLV